MPKFKWEIPADAPAGWGQGYEKGEEYLIEHCGLCRPEHPLWQKLHPEGAEAYFAAENAKLPEHMRKK